MDTDNKKTDNTSDGENLVPVVRDELKYDELDNLGLDADRSSDNQTLSRRYNTDNDVVSRNPDGEDDSYDTNEERGSSPLMDK